MEPQFRLPNSPHPLRYGSKCDRRGTQECPTRITGRDLPISWNQSRPDSVRQQTTGVTNKDIMHDLTDLSIRAPWVIECGVSCSLGSANSIILRCTDFRAEQSPSQVLNMTNERQSARTPNRTSLACYGVPTAVSKIPESETAPRITAGLYPYRVHLEHPLLGWLVAAVYPSLSQTSDIFRRARTERGF